MKKKSLIRLVIIAILFLISITVVRLCGNSDSSVVTFNTTEVAHGNVEISVSATGSIEAIQTVEVGTQVSGVVDKLYADYNSVVKKGQLLAVLDTKPLKISLDHAQAQLAGTKAEMQYQKANFDRAKALFDKSLSSQADFDLAKFNYEKSQASYQSALSEYNKATANLEYAYIYSPIDGVVLDCPVEQGQTVAASFNTPTLFTIVNDLTRMQVEANIDEADIGMIKNGQSVSFTVDAFPEDTFNGTVSEVRLNPIIKNNVVTYAVIINAPNPDQKLMPGMTAGITIKIASAEKVDFIPAEALQFEPEQSILDAYSEQISKDEAKTMQNKITEYKSLQIKNGKSTSTSHIWVKDGNIIYPLIIETGINNGINVEIKKRLEHRLKIILSSTITSASISTEKKESSSPFMPSPPKK